MTKKYTIEADLDNLISKQAAGLEKLKNVKKTLLGKMFV